MHFHEWLDEERGRAITVARHFDIGKSAVSQWRENGVPVDKMLPVQELSGGVVTLAEMLTHREELRRAAAQKQAA